MKNSFLGYYQPSPDEMHEIWDKGLIILDTNALLHLFRYSANAREDLLKVLEAKRSALWIPHQVGLEFHRRRLGVINDQRRAFGEIKKTLEKAQSQITSTFDSFKKHPSLNIAKLSHDFDNAVESLYEKLDRQAAEHSKEMIDNDTNGQILATVTRLYENKIGEKYDDETLKEIYKEGATRYAEKIPPGYEDNKKNEPEKYGDLVLWKQILDQASVTKRHAIFVTDDRKEDWWYIVGGDRHGPRPELIDEYANVSDSRIHLMTSDRFLEFAKTKISDIRTSSVSEAGRLSEYYATDQQDSEPWYHQFHLKDRDDVHPLDSVYTDSEPQRRRIDGEWRKWRTIYSDALQERRNLHLAVKRAQLRLDVLLETQNTSDGLFRASDHEIKEARAELEHLEQEHQSAKAKLYTIANYIDGQRSFDVFGEDGSFEDELV